MFPEDYFYSSARYYESEVDNFKYLHIRKVNCDEDLILSILYIGTAK